MPHALEQMTCLDTGVHGLAHQPHLAPQRTGNSTRDTSAEGKLEIKDSWMLSTDLALEKPNQCKQRQVLLEVERGHGGGDY